jgi:Do/DeqQ family serine protease
MRKRVCVALLFALSVCSTAEAKIDAIRRTPVVVAVEKVGPAVVNVSTEQIIERPSSPFPRFEDPFFDQFFHDFFEPRWERYKQTSLGSGVIIRPDGYILTNQHVVLRGSHIQVTLADNRTFAARLVGADSDSDLAVLKVHSDRPLPAAKLGDSDELLIGETVIAIGNPFGLSHTVTTGVVSAVGRSLKTGGQTYYDFIQTDASINPGNSGGPLLVLTGDVIGINTAIYQKAEGIGFAIPINRARRIVSDLISYGEVHVPWVGAAIQELAPELAARFGVPAYQGVLVRSVEPDSPAAEAGMHVGDVINAIDGHHLSSADEYDQRIRDHAAVSIIRVTVVRAGKSLDLTLHTRSFPEQRAARLAWQLLGIEVAEAHGALQVTRVRPGSSAAGIGIQPGDLITALAGVPVHRLAAFRRKMVEIRLAQSTLLSVQRGPYVYRISVPLASTGGL